MKSDELSLILWSLLMFIGMQANETVSAEFPNLVTNLSFLLALFHIHHCYYCVVTSASHQYSSPAAKLPSELGLRLLKSNYL